MSDYRQEGTGKVITEEQLINFAIKAGLSKEEYIGQAGLVLATGEDPGKEMGATTSDVEVVPQEIPTVSTELASEDTSLVSPEPRKSVRKQVREAELESLAQPEEPEKDIDWLKESGTQLKSGTKATLGRLARIPRYFAELKAGVARDLFLSNEEKKRFDELPDDLQLRIAGGVDPISLSVLDIAEKGEEYFRESQAEVEKINKNLVQFDQSIGEDILEGDLGRAAGRAVSQAIGSIPSIAQAFAGPIGIASIFFGAAAEASAKARDEGMPLGLKSAAYSGTIGASEAALELVTRGIGKSVYKSLLKKPKEAAVQTIKGIALQLAKNFGLEGTSEVATEVINKTADAAFLGKEDVFKDSFTELVDVFIVGGVAGGGMGSIKGGADFVQNRKAKKGIDKIVSTIDATDTSQINTLFDQAMADPVTAAQFDIVKDKNAKLGLSFLLQESLKKGEITKEQASQSLAKFNQVQSAARQVEKTGLDLTSEQEVEVVNLLAEKNNLKSKIEGVDEALASVQKERIKEIDESVKRIAKDASEVKLKAETEVVEKLAGKENVKVFDTTEEFVEATGKPAEADAFEDTDGTIFINKQRAAEVGAFSAPSHELLHRVLKSTFSDKVSSTNLVKDFNKVLEKEGYLDVVQKRIDDNYRFNKDGSEKAFDEYAEEYLTAFSDAIAKKDIEFNETKFQKFMQPIVKFFRKIGYSKIEFKNGRDVYDFVKDYRKNIEKGELSKRATELQAKGQDVTSVAKASVTRINEQIKALEESYDNGELDFDDYDQQLNNLESKLERAKKAEVTKAPGKTIEVFHGGAVKTVNDIGGNIYFSENKKLAEEYAKGSFGEVQSFKINEAEIATEAQVFEVIRELNIQPTIEGWTVDDSRLYELIDDRFDNAFTKEDLSKLNEALAAKGIKAARFTDTDLITGKDTESIVLFDKSAISQETTPKPKAKPVSTAKTQEIVQERKDKKQIGDALNDMIPADMTSAEWKDVAGKIIVKLQDGMLFPLVKKMAARMGIVADNVYGRTYQEFYDEVIGVQLTKNILNFKPKTKENPQGNDDFGGYLIGSQAGITNRIKEALAKFKKEKELTQADDITQAKGVAVEQETTAPVQEKAKYKNLLQQKVLSTEGLKQVRSKMLTIVRVLKSKLDTAISKNASTTPIINEIRLAAGKQLDLTFKEEMGGKKGLKLRNWTIENKQAIVENAPTTWLMGKDTGSKVQGGLPIAIEKSVNGKFLPYPEWVGQKIDRETTEGRGQTSGNQIVRRAKSANINDAEFADFITKENGTPIPGRKEALAKMLAEETAFDLLKLDMQTDGPIFDALKTNQEALGVVITDVVKEEVSRQIERGNVKFSKTLESDMLEGIKVLQENQSDQNSSEFKTWYEKLIDESKKFWDETIAPMFVKQDGAVRSEFTKNKAEQIKKAPFLKEGIEEYNKGVLNSKNIEKANIAKEQLENFWNLIAPLADPAILKIKGLNFLGSASRTSTPDAKVESSLKKKPQNVSKEAQAAFNELLPVIDNVTVYSGNSSAMNAVREFVTSYEGKPSEIAVAFSQDKISEKTKSAKQANTLLFKYLNVLAADAVLNQSGKENVNKAFAGYLRWLETNNNNDAGLKGLAYIMGFEALGNQAVYLDGNGKKFYSLKSESEIIESGKPGVNQLRINKKHTNFTKAKAVLQSQGKLKGLTEFQKDKAIASSLEIMGEHQQSMGETGVNLAEAVAESVQNVFEVNMPKKAALEIYNNRLNAIASNFGIVLNSRFISGIQDKVFGKTSRLGKSRLAAIEKDVAENIFALNGEKIIEQGQQEVLDVVQQLVKVQIHEATVPVDKSKFSVTKKPKILSKEFNEMIARQKGVEVDAEYSKIVAKRMGAKIGKYKLYLPSSAEDFRLLTGYAFSGKGKQGTADMKWFEDNLIRPYTEAIAAIDVAKQTTKTDFKTLNKAMPEQAKTIGNLIPSKDYTNDQAVRVYLWNKAGYNVPGLNEKEVNKLVSYVSGNPRLAIYADSLLAISKSKKWLKPGEHWDVQTILSDINNLTEKGGRKAYLANWIENADAIFSEANMNKIEALYGKRHREALEDALYRMKNGTNRPSGANAQVNRWNNWLNNSIGSIMFFNRRSALLQLLSTTNFLNWSDNNPVNAAKAFANQKQYWSDFSYIFNSDKLKQRRGGLRADVNEAEIANAAANAKNKATAALSWLLKKGFTPTQIADSFAIASGGATFYRNRINTYLAEGLEVKEAEKKAFLDFIETSDQAQQSGDPSLVSMEQASVLGRMVLAFQNTTQQYSRIMKRSGLDLIKRRQMPGTKSMFQSDASNLSKIIYYGALQNLIFSSLSAGLFALIPGFGDNEEEEERNKSKEEKTKRIFNSSVDSLIRGMGVRGAAVITVKNIIQEYFKQKEKEYRADHAYTIIQAVNLSPPIGSKVKKIYSAIKGEQYEKDVMAERKFDVTANGRLNLSPTYRVLGTLASGVLNLPLDRMYSEIQSIAEMLDERNTIYQRLALALGFRSWDVNAKNEEDDLIKLEAKEKRKVKQKEARKEKTAEARELKLARRREAYSLLSNSQKVQLSKLNKNARKKFLDKISKEKGID